MLLLTCYFFLNLSLLIELQAIKIKHTTMKNICLFLIGMGLLVMAGGLFLYLQKKHFVAQAKTATGRVIHEQREYSTRGYLYSPTILYTSLDGKQHSFTAESSAAYAYQVGDQVEVYYEPGKPEETEIKSSSQWVAAWGMSGIGLLLVVIGVSYLVKAIKEEKLYQWLVLHGKKITTNIYSIRQDPSQRLKEGATPYVIYTQWRDPVTSQVHVFKSECMWYDPSAFVPASIDVLVDPYNYKRFHMDLSAVYKQYKSIQAV